MLLDLHPQIAKVIAFMESNMPAYQLENVGRAIGQLAEFLWSKNAHEHDEFVPFRMIRDDEEFRVVGDVEHSSVVRTQQVSTLSDRQPSQQ